MRYVPKDIYTKPPTYDTYPIVDQQNSNPVNRALVQQNAPHSTALHISTLIPSRREQYLELTSYIGKVMSEVMSCLCLEGLGVRPNDVIIFFPRFVFSSSITLFSELRKIWLAINDYRVFRDNCFTWSFVFMCFFKVMLVEIFDEFLEVKEPKSWVCF